MVERFRPYSYPADYPEHCIRCRTPFGATIFMVVEETIRYGWLRQRSLMPICEGCLTENERERCQREIVCEGCGRRVRGSIRYLLQVP